MRLTHAQLITSIDRHAPRNWRRSPLPEPKLLVLPEIESFALSSAAFAQGHLWNEAWADPRVGFPARTVRPHLRAYLLTHQTWSHGVIHFGTTYSAEITRMEQIQEVPCHLREVVNQILNGADDVFQEISLFWGNDSIRLRFVTE